MILSGLMADERYNKWQGLAIAQFSVAVALISGFSVGGLGVGLSLLQNKEFNPTGSFKCAFALALLFLLLTAFLSCAAIITRLLDFRLTARKLRKDKKPDYNKPLTILGRGPDSYGRASWGLFWLACISFALGALLLVITIGGTYADRLH